MQYFSGSILSKIPNMLQNIVTPPRAQGWSNKADQNNVILMGDDHVDDHMVNTPDLTEKLNARDEVSCYNCAIWGSTLTSLLNNEKPSFLTRISRTYEYPFDNEFDVLSWANRAHWVVLGVGKNEKRDVPISLLEQQFRLVLERIMKKNKQVVVVTDKEWTEWDTMVCKVCEELNVDVLYSGNELVNQIVEICKVRVKPPYRIPEAVLALPSLN